MTTPEGWDAAAALAGRPATAWEGRLWRLHKRRYSAEDPGGARLVSGRYNRGLDRFPQGETFPALYLATVPEICLGEIYRHLTPELLPFLNDFRLSELSASLQRVADCRDPSTLGLTSRGLSHDTDYRATQALGRQPSPAAWKVSWCLRRPVSGTTSSSSSKTSSPSR